MKTILESLAEFVVEISYEDIPKPVIHQANRCLLDFMGSFWGGFGVKENRKLLPLAREINPKAEASLWGTGLKAGMAEAAFAHGCIGHHLEYDDGISLGAHWGSETLPAILAMAEASGCGGKEVLTAIVVAYEVGNRVSQAFSRKLLNRGVHFPCTMGIFGAVSGVAKLAKLKSAKIAGALGNACLTPIAPYLTAFSGAPIKDAYAGWPNALGILGTKWSQAGWNGPVDLLEGPEGFGRVAGWVGPVKDLKDQILKGLGSGFEIMKTYFKPYPCCRWLHAPAQAVLDLRREGGWNGEGVDSIVVEGPEFLRSYDQKGGFEKEIAARFSLPYVVAAAVLLGRLDLQAFTKAKRAHPKIRELVKRVTVTTNENFERMFPGHFQTRVRLKTKKGQLLEKTCGLPWAPENPPTDHELEEKFSSLSEGSLRPSRIRDWMALFNDGLEKDKRLKGLLGLLSVNLDR